MRAIHKYPVLPIGRNVVRMSSQRVFKFGVDPEGQLCIWALADTEKPERDVEVWVVGTGWELDKMPGMTEYIDSCNQGPFVWHCFATYDYTH